jgi:pimeloyl-ACP methyl ester carboxylesterase
MSLGRVSRAPIAALLVAAVLAGCGGGAHKPTTRSTSTSTTTTTSKSTSTSATASTSTSTSAATATATAAVAKIQWRPCQLGQCGTLKVPLSYSDPNGKQITLALFRLPAKHPSKRIGTILLNPGGPGASGVQFTRLTAIGFPDSLRARFDIIGWDPRGVGASDPINCGAALARAATLDESPVTAAQRTALAKGDQQFGAACKAKVGAIIGNVGTVDTARDMDRIRTAIGAKRINYIGYSYGTYLGAVYANMFPTHVRAMILDGVSDPGESPTTSFLVQARALDKAIDGYLATCAAHAKCAFHSGGHPQSAFDALVRRIEAHPIAVGHRQLGPTQFFFGVANSLYGDDQTAVAKDLAAAAAGNGRPLLKQFDDYVGRKPNGTYTTEQSANTAINCVDGRGVGDLSAAQKLEHEFVAAAPRFGRFVLYSNLVCGYWPVQAHPPKLPISAKGAPPIVVIGSIRDPITPYSDAVHLAHELHSGVLLTASNAGHTSNFGIGGPCDALGTKYLLTGTPPPNGTHCRPAEN